jgi:hypothetical protein
MKYLLLMILAGCNTIGHGRKRDTKCEEFLGKKECTVKLFGD